MSGAPFDDEAIRLAVYRDLAATGRAPEPPELAARLGVDQAVIREGLRRLAAGRRYGTGHIVVGRVRLGLVRPAPPASG